MGEKLMVEITDNVQELQSISRPVWLWVCINLGILTDKLQGRDPTFQ